MKDGKIDALAISIAVGQLSAIYIFCTGDPEIHVDDQFISFAKRRLSLSHLDDSSLTEVAGSRQASTSHSLVANLPFVKAVELAASRVSPAEASRSSLSAEASSSLIGEIKAETGGEIVAGSVNSFLRRYVHTYVHLALASQA